MSITAKINQLIQEHKHNNLLWFVALFGFGAAFYINFESGFLANFIPFILILVLGIFLAYFYQKSRNSLIYMAIISFLLGGFYVNLYQKLFLDDFEVTGKIYADVRGKVQSIKHFKNKVNGRSGASLVISDVTLNKSSYKSKKRKKKSRNPSQYYIKNNYLNIKDSQDIDLEFIDLKNNYQNIDLQDKKLKKLSITLLKNNQDIAINDIIVASVMINPIKLKNFKDDFDFKKYNKIRGVSASGFVIGKVKIVEKSQISNIDQYFNHLRNVIRGKINQEIEGDKAGIALALLIGDKSQISEELMEKIRNSGLAHLLAISGFHMSLVAMMFFVSARFLLSRNEHLALNFDLKKAAAIFAIIAAYFYLKIAGSPLSAKRAFIMIMMVLIALFFQERINSKRIIILALLIIILSNPYNVLSLSFQLSFVAIMVLGALYEKFNNGSYNRYFLIKVFYYSLAIIFASIIVQIATMPFLMKSFQNISVLGFYSNVFAIPLTSFIVMPLGFLSLFLMIFSLEKFALILMSKSLEFIEKIAIYVANIDFSHIQTAKMTDFGLILAIFAILLGFLGKKYSKIIAIFIFLASFLTISFTKKPDILFDKDQRFFAIYDKEEGLIFSKKIRKSKKRDSWLKRFNQEKFKILQYYSNDWLKNRGIYCEKSFCNINQILILLKRNKISKICQDDSSIIINLTAKYKLPECFKDRELVIDNIDFHFGGSYFFYLNDSKIEVETSA